MSDIDTSGAGRAASDAGLSRKVGPLPIWAWAVILIGGAVLVFYIIRRGQTSTVADNNGAGLAATTDQTAAGALSSMYGTGGNANGYTSGFSNNQAYEQAAISELSGSTQYTPLQIQGALGDLFSGNTLSQTEQSIINSVESALGAPPEYVPTPTLAPPAAASGNGAFNANPTYSVIMRNDAAGTQYALVDPNGSYWQTSNPTQAQEWQQQYGAASNLSWQQWIDKITGNPNSKISVLMENSPAGTQYALSAPGYFEVSQQPGVEQQWVQAFGPAKNLSYTDWLQAQAQSKQAGVTSQ